MEINERKAFLKVKKRNLERKLSKMKEHADMMEDTIELKAEINDIDNELKLM